tara:strand:+ start:319 stop:567 length:249 start_codon:yes stop_codon:yes gene_type:complete
MKNKNFNIFNININIIFYLLLIIFFVILFDYKLFEGYMCSGNTNNNKSSERAKQLQNDNRETAQTQTSQKRNTQKKIGQITK